jgi:hypothetical protein
MRLPQARRAWRAGAGNPRRSEGHLHSANVRIVPNAGLVHIDLSRRDRRFWVEQHEEDPELREVCGLGGQAVKAGERDLRSE